MTKPRSVVIGSGFSGLSAACHLAAAGHEVTVLEKHQTAGGRARQFNHDGFVFDMGPSWYWMPDVFDSFFKSFGKTVDDYYDLTRLDPSYRIYFGPGEVMDVPAGLKALEAMFERYEPGSGTRLKQFMTEAAYKYQVGMQDFVKRPSHSIFEFADWRILASLFRLQMFSSISKQIRKNFHHSHLVQLLEFPVLFLGAKPEKTPALYSLMNYADMALGTWYPMGGMYKIVGGMVSVARELGVQFEFGAEVNRIEAPNGRATHVWTTEGRQFPADFVVGGGDYHHIDTQILNSAQRQYSDRYWDTRTMAPSCILFYLGVNKRLKGLLHHNLFFDADFGLHAREIYDHPKWPERPLFYVSAPSVTDSSVAPEGCENLFILIPVAPGLEDDETIREHYYELVMDRLEQLTGQDVRNSVVYKRSFAHADFVSEYHAFKGNAYGLANTLLQTAFLKPKLKSKKITNLFYTGQLTVPGPGVPPSLISGEVVAREISKVSTKNFGKN